MAKLEPDAKTKRLIRSLAGMNATKEEAATALGVTRPTLWAFFKAYPDIEELWQDGLNDAKTSLRRLQWKLAKSGSVTMAIFLGKNILGQKDQFGMEHKGRIETDVTQVREGIERKLAVIADTHRTQGMATELN